MESIILAPVVSVIIPVHGDAPYLFSTIKSIEMQDFKEFETLIILDRVSKDIETYTNNLALNSEKFKVIVSKKPGISNVLNLGISESSGEYIARIDADDLMRRDRLKLQLAFLEINQDVVCVGSQVTKINADGIQIGESSYPLTNKQIIKNLLFRNCIAHPSVMYRRSAIIQTGGYRHELNGAEDYDLWLRISRLGKIVNLNEPLTLYRVWPNQITWKDKHRSSSIAELARKDFQAATHSQKNLAISENELSIRKYTKSPEWISAANHFNTALTQIHQSGKRLESIKNMIETLRLTPLLSTQITFGYFWRYSLSRFKRLIL